MEAKAKFLGHPLHQMLVPLPFGLLAMAAVFDLIQLVTGDGSWHSTAYLMIGAGVVTALIAAVFGAIDWNAIPSGTRAKRVGAVHGLGNIVVVVLYAVSWFLRRDLPQDPGAMALLLSFAGAALAVVTGWLGGELVDRLGVGVDRGAHLDAPSSLSGLPASHQLGSHQPSVHPV